MSNYWTVPGPDIELLSYLINVAVKPLFIVFLVFYALFSILVVRQVQLLNKTLGTELSPLLRFITVFNLILVFLIILWINI